MDVINPMDIDTTMDDVGGCENIKKELVSLLPTAEHTVPVFSVFNSRFSARIDLGLMR